MNCKALVTALVVLGSASAALAGPAVSGPAVSGPAVSGPAISGPAVSGPAISGPAGPAGPAVFACGTPPIAPVWTTLGAMNRIADGRMDFDLRREPSGFMTLKLRSTAGKSLIQRVEVRFRDGRTQVVPLGRYLMAGRPDITIDLAGEAPRTIDRVTVVGRNARRSAYSVLAI